MSLIPMTPKYLERLDPGQILQKGDGWFSASSSWIEIEDKFIGKEALDNFYFRPVFKESSEWAKLPEGLGYFWYRNCLVGAKTRPCEIRESDDMLGRSCLELSFLRGESWELCSFIKSNPSGEFAPCVPPPSFDIKENHERK